MVEEVLLVPGKDADSLPVVTWCSKQMVEEPLVFDDDVGVETGAMMSEAVLDEDDDDDDARRSTTPFPSRHHYHPYNTTSATICIPSRGIKNGKENNWIKIILLQPLRLTSSLKHKILTIIPEPHNNLS